MKKNLLLLIIIIAALTSCSTSKKTTDSDGNLGSSMPAPAATEEGLSYETAVVINETNEGDGVNAEYKWISRHYPHYKTKSQSLTSKNGKPYDIINIKASGKNVKLYFDISKFFGKF